MRLSMELYTLAERFGDLKAMDLMKELGFNAIDYSYYYTKECEEVLGEGYREYAKKLRTHLDKIGLVCNQAHAPFTFRYGMEIDPSDPKYLNLVRAIESAAILGAENIVIHSVAVPEGEDLIAYNLEFYRSFIPYCEKFGIHVAVENLLSMDKKRQRRQPRFGTPETLIDFVRRVDSPWIVACVDLGHAALTDEEPEVFVEKMDPSILKCLHVQDNCYTADDHVLPFIGDHNWEAVMKALKKIGYKGDLTLEIVKYLRRFPDELLPEAVRFAATVGKYLIRIYEEN